MLSHSGFSQLLEHGNGSRFENLRTASEMAGVSCRRKSKREEVSAEVVLVDLFGIALLEL